MTIKETTLILQDDEIHTLMQNAFNACKFCHTAFRQAAEANSPDEDEDTEYSFEGDNDDMWGDDNFFTIVEVLKTDILEVFVNSLNDSGKFKPSEYVTQLLLEREEYDRWDDDVLVKDYHQALDAIVEHICGWLNAFLGRGTAIMFVLENLSNFELKNSGGGDELDKIVFDMTTDVSW